MVVVVMVILVVVVMVVMVELMVVWVGGRVQLSKIDLSILLEHFPGVLFSTTVRDLGVTLDQELTLSRHVGSVCRSSFYHLLQTRSVRRSLTFKTARTQMP